MLSLMSKVYRVFGIRIKFQQASKNLSTRSNNFVVEEEQKTRKTVYTKV